MDDFKIWFYVILGIVYLLSRALKKPKTDSDQNIPENRPPQREFPSQQTTSSKPKALTFEELLKEIAEAKTQQPKPVSSPVPQASRRIDYDDDLEEEEKSLEVEKYDYREKERINTVYEEAKRQAFLRPSLEETLKLEDTEVKFAKFKGFEIVEEVNVMDRYISDFKDPESIRKAIIMNEILNRRAF